MTRSVALITGGATGIGKAVALKLAIGGTAVILTGRRQEVGDAAVTEIAAVARRDAQVRFVRSDVSDEGAVKAVIDDIVTEFGRLDLAVNNAGVSNEAGPLDQSNSQNYRDMVDTNILGVYFCMKYEITQMLRQGKGAIVNLA